MELQEVLTAWLTSAQMLYFVIAAAVFVILYFISAPYGRHTRAGWGPTMNANHGWIMMETVSVLVPLALVIIAEVTVSLVTIIFMIMWFGHYCQRSFFYTWQRRGTQRTYPIAIALLATIFNILNSYINTWDVFHMHRYDASWLMDPRFLIGVSLFCLGAWINISSDNILLKLRKPGDEGYKVPNKGYHRLVASPNYFGELLEWTGWAIATWSISGALFAFFTFANLGPRALTNLQWYRDTFAEYPKERKAMIPYVY